MNCHLSQTATSLKSQQDSRPLEHFELESVACPPNRYSRPVVSKAIALKKDNSKW